MGFTQESCCSYARETTTAGRIKHEGNHTSEQSPFIVNEKNIEKLLRYVQPGKKYARDEVLLLEVKRNILFGREFFAKVYNVLRSHKSIVETKRELFNVYLQPALTYGLRNLLLNTTTAKTLALAQRKIERIMLGITLRDRKINTWRR